MDNGSVDAIGLVTADVMKENGRWLIKLGNETEINKDEQ
jgi:hypothetical protein